jgi:large subunit ribosomal protein L21
MHAVIVSGGKQHRVRKGEVLRLEKIDVEPGESFHFDQVLMVGDGENAKLGVPLVSGAKVTAIVCSHGRMDTIEVFKFKRRKKYRRSQGHRQWYTEVKIQDIVMGAASKAPAATKTADTKAADTKTADTKAASSKAPEKAVTKAADKGADKVEAQSTAQTKTKPKVAEKKAAPKGTTAKSKAGDEKTGK